MKKIYTLLALCLVGIMSMSAKDYYTIDGLSAECDYPSLASFETGVQYVLGSTRTNAKAYLTPKGSKLSVSESSIYEFEEAGTDKQGTTTYLIKNVQSGEYLTSDFSTYTTSRARAQAFTIMQAKVFHSEKNDQGKYFVDWSSVNYDPRSATMDMDTNGKYPLADDFIPYDDDGNVKAVCWVIAQADTQTEKAEDGSSHCTYLCTTDAYKPYLDTNSWAIYKPKKISGAAAMEPAFQDILGGQEFNPDDYPVGTAPGQYSEEAVNKMVDAWEVFSELLNFGGTDAACDEAIANLLEAYEYLMSHMNKLEDGNFYRFWNYRDSGEWMTCMYEEGGTLKYTKKYVAPEELDANAAKYIWKLVQIDGKNYFQNYYTGRYVNDQSSKSTPWNSSAEPIAAFNIIASDLPGTFNVVGTTRDQNWGMNTIKNTPGICYWNAGSSSKDKESLWKVETIDPKLIEALEAEIEQARKNTELSDLLLKATTTYNKGFAYRQYLTEPSQITVNRQEVKEGPLANLFDGDYNTYYHSTWSEPGDQGQPHWFQIELNEPISEFTLDCIRRGINSNTQGAVTRWAVVGTNDANLAATDDYVAADPERDPEDITPALAPTLQKYQQTWDCYQLVESAYDKMVIYNDTQYKKAMASFNVKLDKPCKYLRFLTVLRMKDTLVKDTLESGEVVDAGIIYDGIEKNQGNIFMCLGEIALHGTEFDESISLINGVPADVRKALEDAIAKAQEEVDAKNATTETIALLKEAYNNFLDKFPVPEQLLKAIADAQTWVEEAPVGNEVGNFPEGATADLEKVIEQVNGTVKDIMTSDEIAAGKSALNEAINALQSKLILPAEGIYFLHSATDETSAAFDAYVADFNTGHHQLTWRVNGGVENQDNPAYFWCLSKNADNTWSLFNYGTGNTLQSVGEIKTKADPVFGGTGEAAKFTLRSARVAGCFNIVLADGAFLNTDPKGTIVTWGTGKGYDNSAFEFIDASEEWNGDYAFYYEAGKPQIMTLPYALNNDCVEPLYKLIGTYNNAFQFEEYKEDEVIPAGTPVLYFSEDEAYTNDAFSLTTDDLTALTYTTEAKTQNGMVGTLEAIDELPLGCGIFWNGTVIGSEAGEGIDANSGYLLLDATTDHEGTLSIAYDESVKTLQEGIQNAVVVNSKSGRGTFNLMGQKVQGKLPAGLYIVNGKKYLVK